ncbi:hypothetical protein [Aquabacterium sp.]|uniref:hypothetical protein n=1 Tax=Aquabacterium sp. TaxID=1872578 RepID=UPI002C032FD4|nr:hypothetical protein [Aquabacterium sp.]HSW04441.1 hypothetical protein [Aquabacterium sp.]
MPDHEKIAIAARLHVLLRRRLGRVTDVEWMVKSADYAREVVRVSRAAPYAELHEWADRLEAAVVTQPDAPLRHPVLAPAGAPPSTRRYVNTIR